MEHYISIEDAESPQIAQAQTLEKGSFALSGRNDRTETKMKVFQLEQSLETDTVPTSPMISKMTPRDGVGPHDSKLSGLRQLKKPAIKVQRQAKCSPTAKEAFILKNKEKLDDIVSEMTS